MTDTPGRDREHSLVPMTQPPAGPIHPTSAESPCTPARGWNKGRTSRPVVAGIPPKRASGWGRGVFLTPEDHMNPTDFVGPLLLDPPTQNPARVAEYQLQLAALRFEASKAVLAAFPGKGGPQAAVKIAIQWADELIRQLKETS